MPYNQSIQFKRMIEDLISKLQEVGIAFPSVKFEGYNPEPIFDQREWWERMNRLAQYAHSGRVKEAIAWCKEGCP